jgi:hypothetical protein
MIISPTVLYDEEAWAITKGLYREKDDGEDFQGVKDLIYPGFDMVTGDI